MNSRVQKDRSVRRVIVIEGSANVLVLGIKVVVGLSTGSLAILGDAVHSLTDVINNIVAWFVIRVSGEPADRDHPYGHRKFETLAVFSLAALLVILGFELALQAIRRDVVDVVTGTWELGLMITVLTVNIALAAWEKRWAGKLESGILHADASHTFADVLTTIVVIGGWQLSAMGFLWLDRACALGVAGLVLYLAYGLFKRAIPVLVDESAIDPALIVESALNIKGVNKVSRVRSRWMGPDRVVDMIVIVDSGLSTVESHQIADQVESMLEERFDIRDTSIHIEPGK